MNLRRCFEGLAVVIVLAGGSSAVLMTVATTAADAHELVSHNANCQSVNGTFKDFPSGKVDVTVTGAKPVGTFFTGPSGSVSASWSQLGVDTSKGGVHSYSFSWTADNGGNAGPFTYDAKGCVPPTTTSTTASKPTTSTSQPPASTTIPKPSTTAPAVTPTTAGCLMTCQAASTTTTAATHIGTALSNTSTTKAPLFEGDHNPGGTHHGMSVGLMAGLVVLALGGITIVFGFGRRFVRR